MKKALKILAFVLGGLILAVVLFIAGLVSLAFPLLVIGLLAAFLWPVLKRS